MLARTLILAAVATAALSSAALAQGYGFGGPTAMHRGYSGWGGGYGPGSTNRLGPGFGPGDGFHRIDGGRGGTIVGPTIQTFPPGYRQPRRPEPIYMPARPGQGYGQPTGGW